MGTPLYSETRHTRTEPKAPRDVGGTCWNEWAVPGPGERMQG
jgi:hypothetical protein